MIQVGSRVLFETRTGRRGEGEVLCTRNPINDAYPLQLRWYDSSGKHYEWFHPAEFLVCNLTGGTNAAH